MSLSISSTRLLCGVLACAFLAGCAGVQQKKNFELDSVLATGNYREAALIAERRMGMDGTADPSTRAPVQYKAKYVLEHLEAAEAWRMIGDQPRALEHYDSAEVALGDVNENTGKAVAGKLGAALVNETLAGYVPSPAESVLINYYKALMFWADGKPDHARVELNRGDDRTRRAVERYAKEIESARTEAAKNNSNQTYDNPQVSDSINSQFPEMSQWQPYSEFVLPPATYLQALYLAHSADPADREKSIELYERLLGLVGAHPTLESDFTELQSPSALCPEQNCIWVVIERGQGPELLERRFAYPVVTRDGLIHVQMALPALASRFDPYLSNCHITSNEDSFDCAPFASMDRVIQTEFSKRFPGIVTRAVVSSAVKALAQNEVNKRAGVLGGLLAQVITSSVTTADVRMWRLMPGDFTLNRLQRDGDTITINIGDQSVIVPVATGSQLIHVKAPLPYHAPVITHINL